MPDGPAEDLYGLPLSRFIPERDALVKALRKDKRRDEATAVAGMRKPSVAAWAVNQLVRTQHGSVTALFKAGDALADAQGRAASGKAAADALREASRRQAEAIAELLEAAEGLLTSDGHQLTAATLERVRETLRAASIDPASRELVTDGCLVQELQFAGLGVGDSAVPPGERAGKEAPASKTDRAAKGRAAERTGAAGDDRAQHAKDKREQDAARAREREIARERAAALAAARKAQTQARRAAARADKELSAAQDRREQAAAALLAADELLAAATTRAEETAAEADGAERAVRELL